MKQVLDDTLNRIVEAQGYHERAPELGERAWRVRGKFLEVVYWDMGNGWCDVIHVVPKRGHEECLEEFFHRIEASKDV